MILRDVRQTMKALGVASATQLAAELHLRRAEVDSALEFWVQRGDIRICTDAHAGVCGTACKRCPIGDLKRKPQVADTLVRLSGLNRKSRRGAGGRHAGRFGLSKHRRSASPLRVYEWVSD